MPAGTLWPLAIFAGRREESPHRAGHSDPGVGLRVVAVRSPEIVEVRRRGAHRVARSTGVSKDLVLADELHLLWQRQLWANLSAPLSLDTEVSA